METPPPPEPTTEEYITVHTKRGRLILPLAEGWQREGEGHGTALRRSFDEGLTAIAQELKRITLG